MGNISSHAHITRRGVAELEAIRRNEDYFFIELGNYLTDVSQFRDPTAQFAAKRVIYQEALERAGIWGTWGLNRARVPQWIDALMGSPRERHGALSQFFFNVIHAMTLMMGQAARVPEDEINRIFDINFTQYYPHEHLDFPPVTHYRHYRTNRRFQAGRRNLIGYLEEHIQYLAEGFSAIELQWKQAAINATQSEPERHDVLVALGHVLHAIEDFYFHANFVETLWFRLLWREHQGLAQPNEAGELEPNFWESWFDDNALDRRREGIRIRFRRKFYRRLRFPVMDPGVRNREGRPSQTTSTDATHLVYTGGFGDTDLNHTLYEALEGFEEHADRVGMTSVWADSGLVLLENVFVEENRRRLVHDEAYKTLITDRHREQLNANEYETRIEEQVERGILTRGAGNALRAAFEIDRDISNRFPQTPGLGGFLITLATRVQEEADQSRRHSNSLDKLDLVRDARTNNRASAEQIGTHSLMAKDTNDSGPFRGEALALAIHASTNIALILARETNDQPGDRSGLWWDGIVRHYIRFPRVRRGAWEQEIFRRQARVGVSPGDWALNLGDAPRLVRFPPTHPQLAARRAGGTRQRLENEYQALEVRADRAYQRAQS